MPVPDLASKGNSNVQGPGSIIRVLMTSDCNNTLHPAQSSFLPSSLVHQFSLINAESQPRAGCFHISFLGPYFKHLGVYIPRSKGDHDSEVARIGSEIF